MTNMEYVMSKNPELDEEDTIRDECPDYFDGIRETGYCCSNCHQCWHEEVVEEED